MTSWGNALTRAWEKFAKFWPYYFNNNRLNRIFDHWTMKVELFAITVFTLICTVYVDIIANSNHFFPFVAPATVFAYDDRPYPINETLLNYAENRDGPVKYLFLVDESASIDPNVENDAGQRGDSEKSTRRKGTIHAATDELINILEKFTGEDHYRDQGLPRLFTMHFLQILDNRFEERKSSDGSDDLRFCVYGFDGVCKSIGKCGPGYWGREKVPTVLEMMKGKPNDGTRTDFVTAFQTLRDRRLIPDPLIEPMLGDRIVLTIISDFNDDQNLYSPDFRSQLEKLRLVRGLQVNLVILPSYDVRRSEQVVEMFRDEFKVDRLSIYYVHELATMQLEQKRDSEKRAWLRSIVAPKKSMGRKPLNFKFENQYFEKAHSSIAIKSLIAENVLITLRAVRGKDQNTYVSKVQINGGGGVPHGLPKLLKENYSAMLTVSSDEEIMIDLEHHSKFTLPDLYLEVFPANSNSKILIPMHYVQQLPMWGAYAMFVFEMVSLVFFFVVLWVFFRRDPLDRLHLQTFQLHRRKHKLDLRINGSIEKERRNRKTKKKVNKIESRADKLVRRQNHDEETKKAEDAKRSEVNENLSRILAFIDHFRGKTPKTESPGAEPADASDEVKNTSNSTPPANGPASGGIGNGVPAQETKEENDVGDAGETDSENGLARAWDWVKRQFN